MKKTLTALVTAGMMLASVTAMASEPSTEVTADCNLITVTNTDEVGQWHYVQVGDGYSELFLEGGESKDWDGVGAMPNASWAVWDNLGLVASGEFCGQEEPVLPEPILDIDAETYEALVAEHPEQVLPPVEASPTPVGVRAI